MYGANIHIWSTWCEANCDNINDWNSIDLKQWNFIQVKFNLCSLKYAQTAYGTFHLINDSWLKSEQNYIHKSLLDDYSKMPTTLAQLSNFH